MRIVLFGCKSRLNFWLYNTFWWRIKVHAYILLKAECRYRNYYYWFCMVFLDAALIIKITFAFNWSYFFGHDSCVQRNDLQLQFPRRLHLYERITASDGTDRLRGSISNSDVHRWNGGKCSLHRRCDNAKGPSPARHSAEHASHRPSHHQRVRL